MPELTDKQKCIYCKKETERGKVYKCLDCCDDFSVCSECNLKYYVREQVQRKRYLDNLYQRMELQPILSEKQEREISSHPQSETETAEEKVARNIKMHEFLIKDTFKNISLDTSSAQKEYANVVESKNPANDSSDKQERNALKEFCLIALWKLKDERWECYRMFKVENPAILKYKIDPYTTQRQFIHVGHNNELFYFTKERKLGSKDDYVCQILDIKTAMTCTESQLEKSTANYFTPPN